MILQIKFISNIYCKSCYNNMPKIFAEVSEKEISRSIAAMFMETMNEYTDSDVIIIGAGPAGLSAGRELGNLGIRTLII